MIIKQIFTEPETDVKWYFDSIEEIVIVYIRNRLRGTFVCACNTLRLRLRLHFECTCVEFVWSIVAKKVVMVGNPSFCQQIQQILTGESLCESYK